MAKRRIGLWLATLALLGLAVAPARAQHGASASDPQPLVDASAGAAPVAPSAEVRAAAKSLRQQLGSETVVDIDPKTGTPRQIVSLDGFLTGPRPGEPAEIARHWIGDNAALLGLGHDDIHPLRKVDESTSPAGITAVTFAQTFAGLQAFNSFIRVSVAPHGQVLNVTGSPTPALDPDATKPLLSAAQARARAMADVGATTTDGEAQLVLFAIPHSAARLAWYLTSVPAPTGDYVFVVDALDGRILWRQNTTDAATGLAWDYYPSSLAQGGSGTQQSRDFSGNGWLSSTTQLSGPNARVFADLNDNNLADSGEQIPPTGGNWNYAPTFFTGAAPLSCTTAAPCTWNPFVASSWTTNERQTATQLFYYVNTFHDWLSGDPFGFTQSSGNFEGDDPVEAQALDGANGPGGLPDSRHLDNANMSTPPDGQSPRMQMYLFTANVGGKVTAMNAGDDASVVYHEYTHGLTSRLITMPSGNSGLTTDQAGAMGEGWSDWYAMDYLFGHGFDSGPVNIGFFMNGNRPGEPGSGTLRTQPMNCRPGATMTTDGSERCDGSAQAGNGGYTFGDYGKVVGYPEVHADGEIWAQMLWALREDLIAQYGPTEGMLRARRLVTEGLRLTPPAPSMLDARNAILAAETATTAGQDRDALWNDFAGHGMGYFASVVDGDDVQPVQDTHTQPVGPAVAVTGHVTDADSGLPVAGIRVGFGGHMSDLASDLVAQTDSSGAFTIPAVPQGTYPEVLVDGAGYDRAVPKNVVVGPNGATIDVAVRRDWAATAGGASIVSSSAPNYSSPCSASDAFDLSQGTGWASTSPANTQAPGSKQVTLQLPQPIDLTSFAIDPGAICGDGDAASVGQLQIETSADGVNFAPAAASTFGAADDHRLNTLAPSANAFGVRYLRVTMLGPQSNSGDGAQYMDLAELKVYGRPAGVPAPPGSGGSGGGGSGGGGTPGTTPGSSTGGGSLPSPFVPPGPTTPSAPAPAALTLANVRVKRCAQAIRRGRAQLVCTLVNARVVSLVDARLMQGRKTLARGSRLKPSRVGTVTLKLKRKLKKGRYAATLKLHDRAGHTRTVTSRFRVLK